MAVRDITLGQYFPGESCIHRLDPRVKIVCALVYLVSLFVVQSFWAFGLCILLLAAVIILSGVPFKFISKGLKPVIFLIIITMLINVLFVRTGEPVLTIGKFFITNEGIYRALFMGLRLVLLIFGSSMLTLTTKPIELTDGMEKLLSPLAKIGLPAHELAMMMTIALRFIPTLLDETDKIMKAQTARGADFENGTLREKAKALIPLLVPLFVSAFRIAGDLAMAMEARCYHGGKGRTRLHQMKLGKGDAVAIIVMLVYLGCIIGSRYININIF
ncbi:MAG: energy-coupling factor transporter transmembrane protein EcfT [Firmicutes bacterium]|nr:energy-coupling factor transporter transmembrane protein EcfT [Bacillota bacterium]